jgi:MSHA pilin protein MshD
MAETVVSTLLVGLVLVGTLQIVAPITRSGSVMADKAIAANLARELSDEISTKYFTSPIQDDVESMGAGDGETRATYDDIDDYHGLSNTPPQLSGGEKIPNLVGWTRTVKVVHADLDDPTLESGSYTGLKRVTVSVSKDGTLLAQTVTLHTHAADQLGFVLQEP